MQDDEYCFLYVIELILYTDYDEVIKLDEMVNSILAQLADNAEY